MDLEHWLHKIIEKKGSDLLIMVGVPAMVKVNGELSSISDQKLSPEQTEEIVTSMMSDKQKAEFSLNRELNFNYYYFVLLIFVGRIFRLNYRNRIFTILVR